MQVICMDRMLEEARFKARRQTPTKTTTTQSANWREGRVQCLWFRTGANRPQPEMEARVGKRMSHFMTGLRNQAKHSHLDLELATYVAFVIINKPLHWNWKIMCFFCVYCYWRTI